MTISSLQDLNTYAQTPITYDDVRTAQVIFDRGATVDQTLVTPENGDFVSPWGINIETITQPDVAEVEYHLDYSAFADPISITWSFLPAHITVVRTNNIWVVSGIENSEDWLYARNATVLPPFGFSGVVQHSAAIHYYSDTQDSTKNIAAWDINLTVTQVEYFSVPAPQTYVSNTLYSQLNTTRITNDPEDFDPVWDLRIYSADENLTPVDAIEEMFSDGSAAEAAWNNSTNQYVITGDTESVNDVLDTLDLETGKYSTDFFLVFRLANNFTSDLEYQIQTFSSRDFIIDPVVVATQTTAPNYIFGAFVDLIATATSTPSINVIRSANAEFVASADIDSTPNAIFDPGADLNSVVTINSVATRIFQLESTIETTATISCEPTRIRPGIAQLQTTANMTSNAYKHQGGLVFTFDTNETAFNLMDPSFRSIGELGQPLLTNTLEIDWIDGNGTIHSDSATFSLSSTSIQFNYPGSYVGPVTAVVVGDFTRADIRGLNSLDRWSDSTYQTRKQLSIQGVGRVPSDLPSSYIRINFKTADGFGTDMNISELTTWNTSNLTKMDNMFNTASSFNQDISGWNTSNVTTMRSMFDTAASFDQDISSWNVSNVTDSVDFDSNTSASWTSAEKPTFT